MAEHAYLQDGPKKWYFAHTPFLKTLEEELLWYNTNQPRLVT